MNTNDFVILSINDNTTKKYIKFVCCVKRLYNNFNNSKKVGISTKAILLIIKVF